MKPLRRAYGKVFMSSGNYQDTFRKIYGLYLFLQAKKQKAFILKKKNS
jgi:hypothetical protein